MKSVARLTLTFDDAASAEAVAAAVALDDEGYLRTTRRGRTLIAEASAEAPMGLLRTLDDYLACISVAERTRAEARPRGRAPRRPASKPSSPAGSSPPGLRRRGRPEATPPGPRPLG